jgi:predicted O-linked N-acetylglucosamine transferase (SPINDLY family)
MSSPAVPTFNPRELLHLYENEKHDALSEALLGVLRHFEQTTYMHVGGELRYFIDAFMKHFLYLFTQVDYLPNQQDLVRFVNSNLTIANLAAMSSFHTTDPFVEILSRQPRNYGKLLAIYSPRNNVKIDPKFFFDTDASLASLWFSQALDMYRSGSVNPVARANLKRLVTNPDERINNVFNLSDVYFGATYLDGSADRQIRELVSRRIKAGALANAPKIENTPNPRHIAIASSLYFPGHSVYRILSDFVEALREDYQLTLLHLGPMRDNIDIGPFHRLKYIGFHDGSLNIESIRRNDFGMVFFPDVGMTTESIFLANLRIAPIQVCGLGQSVSTFASEIDYYISGADVELLERSAENYSERLVLLPGFGCVHRHPTYELQKPARREDRFVINCSWYPQKVNCELLGLAKRIIEQANKPVYFRLFVGGGLARKNDHLPFVMDVENALGRENVEVVAGKAYQEYMAAMEEGEISIDSAPFGGCNVIADSLYLRKPTVAYEGTKWYNRIGPAMLRSVGFQELIATNDDEYVQCVVRLINDDAYRNDVQQRLNAADLVNTIFSTQTQGHFKHAIAQLMKHHEEYQRDETRQPIFVSADAVAAEPRHATGNGTAGNGTPENGQSSELCLAEAT